MNTPLALILLVLVASASLLGTMAYGVDNNCLTNVGNIFQVPLSLGCIEERLDALENKTVSGVQSISCSLGITCTGTTTVSITPNYQLLCTNTLGSAGTSLACSSFTAKKYLHVEYILKGDTTNSMVVGVQFNGDTGANYAYRLYNNNGADSGATSQNQGVVNGNALANSAVMWGDLDCYNRIGSDRKVCYSRNVTDANAGVTITNNQAEGSIKWGNTSNQITTVTLMRQALTGQMAAGSQITVWGYD